MVNYVENQLIKKELQEEYNTYINTKIPTHSRHNNDDILFSASEASERTDLQIQRNLNDIMRPIVNKINKAINEMKKYCYIDSLTEIQRMDLTAKGYKVDFIQGDPRDPRENSKYKISWS